MNIENVSKKIIEIVEYFLSEPLMSYYEIDLEEKYEFTETEWQNLIEIVKTHFSKEKLTILQLLNRTELIFETNIDSIFGKFEIITIIGLYFKKFENKIRLEKIVLTRNFRRIY